MGINESCKKGRNARASVRGGVKKIRIDAKKWTPRRRRGFSCIQHERKIG